MHWRILLSRVGRGGPNRFDYSRPFFSRTPAYYRYDKVPVRPSATSFSLRHRAVFLHVIAAM